MKYCEICKHQFNPDLNNAKIKVECGICDSYWPDIYAENGLTALHFSNVCWECDDRMMIWHDQDYHNSVDLI